MPMMTRELRIFALCLVVLETASAQQYNGKAQFIRKGNVSPTYDNEQPVTLGPQNVCLAPVCHVDRSCTRQVPDCLTPNPEHIFKAQGMSIRSGTMHVNGSRLAEGLWAIRNGNDSCVIVLTMLNFQPHDDSSHMTICNHTLHKTLQNQEMSHVIKNNQTIVLDFGIPEPDISPDPWNDAFNLTQVNVSAGELFEFPMPEQLSGVREWRVVPMREQRPTLRLYPKEDGRTIQGFTTLDSTGIHRFWIQTGNYTVANGSVLVSPNRFHISRSNPPNHHFLTVATVAEPLASTVENVERLLSKIQLKETRLFTDILGESTDENETAVVSREDQLLIWDAQIHNRRAHIKWIRSSLLSRNITCVKKTFTDLFQRDSERMNEAVLGDEYSSAGGTEVQDRHLDVAAQIATLTNRLILLENNKSLHHHSKFISCEASELQDSFLKIFVAAMLFVIVALPFTCCLWAWCRKPVSMRVNTTTCA